MAGRTKLTTPGAIQRVALELFERNGFEETKIEDIAAAAGIGRGTFFRYFASKNDVPFGDMEPMFEAMDDWLSSLPNNVDLLDALSEAVVRFNVAHADGLEAHRKRMSLVHRVPVLQAHRAFRALRLEDLFARFAGRQLGQSPTALGPRLVGQMANGAAVAAYDVWLEDEQNDLEELLRTAFGLLNLTPITG